jgi:hypothetical protein
MYTNFSTQRPHCSIHSRAFRCFAIDRFGGTDTGHGAQEGQIEADAA